MGWNDYSLTSFWIQLHNLPLHGRTKEIGELIGHRIGVCQEVETDENGKCLGRFVRIRVQLDISSPLRRGSRVMLGNDTEIVLVDLRYERLLEFCFIYGRVGHSIKECSLRFEVDVSDLQALNYGSWLRASYSF
ncbi:Zinc knuckle CX2CX4HX4C [Trema orientale]|uniref:Zinc knuckle CX2CX4HX4C n=1 Tax=Trema orientale TaxID=63057 RepID=A0A2P5C5M3_TREOI|nr:Zinc knuckle CX2CX4HX4C [Trema orientale]